MTAEIEELERITVDPGQMGGAPCIRGVRIPVATVLGMLADGMTSAEIQAAYPGLAAADVRAALLYGARLCEPDLWRLRRCLEALDWPRWVDRFDAHTMRDHDGELSLDVRVIVRPDDRSIVRDGQALATLAERIHTALENAGVDLWPYVRFVAADELDDEAAVIIWPKIETDPKK